MVDTPHPARPRAPRWGVAVVRGASMRPLLEVGDRLLVRYAGPVRRGSVVVARFPDGAVVVKRAADERRTRDGRAAWWLLSEDPGAGVDSRHRGPVAAEDVLGTAVLRLWPRPRRLRPAAPG